MIKMLLLSLETGFNNERTWPAINELRTSGIKTIIGPTSFKEFEQVKKYSDLIFISPSNIDPKFSNNVISIGVSLESQLTALTKFIKKQKKNKTIIMYPKNQYKELIEEKLNDLNLKNVKIFTYSSNPEVLTGEIELLTNYSQRKKNLELRKKLFEDKEDEQSVKQLERLEQLYT